MNGRRLIRTSTGCIDWMNGKTYALSTVVSYVVWSTKLSTSSDVCVYLRHKECSSPVSLLYYCSRKLKSKNFSSISIIRQMSNIRWPKMKVSRIVRPSTEFKMASTNFPVSIPTVFSTRSTLLRMRGFERAMSFKQYRFVSGCRCISLCIALHVSILVGPPMTDWAYLSPHRVIWRGKSGIQKSSTI